jgi:hypothetical protein
MKRLCAPRVVVIVAAVACAGGTGCAPKLAPASLIVDERLLAIVVDPPETVVGQSVTFSPFVVSPDGSLEEGAGYTARWWRCPDSDSDSLGDFSQCSDPSARVDLGGGVPYVDQVPTDLFGELPDPASVLPGGPSGGLAGGAADDTATDDASVFASQKALGALLGYWRVVGVSVRGEATDKLVEGYKREPVFLPVPLAQLDPRLAAVDVRVAPEGEVAQKNTNPLLTAVTIHEDDVTGPSVERLEKGRTYAFVPHYDARALEAYQSLRADLAGLPLGDAEAMSKLSVEDVLPRFEKVQRCEVPLFNWFVTAGSLRREVTLDEGVVTEVFDERRVPCPAVEGEPRTPETLFTAPAGTEEDPLPDEGVVHAWVVMRDGRGGTAVHSFDLPVE